MHVLIEHISRKRVELGGETALWDVSPKRCSDALGSTCSFQQDQMDQCSGPAVQVFWGLCPCGLRTVHVPVFRSFPQCPVYFSSPHPAPTLWDWPKSFPRPMSRTIVYRSGQDSVCPWAHWKVRDRMPDFVQAAVLGFLLVSCFYGLQWPL